MMSIENNLPNNINNSNFFNIDYDTMNIIFNYLSFEERLSLRLINKNIINYIINSNIKDTHIKFNINELFKNYELIHVDKLTDNFYNYISCDKLEIEIMELHNMINSFCQCNDIIIKYNDNIYEFKNITTLKYFNHNFFDFSSNLERPVF